MCGIAGMLRHDRSAVEGVTLERMVRAMVHPGADDEGIWLDRTIGLGHRRLSIIERATGHQPLCIDYAVTSHLFAFASEVEPLLTIDEIQTSQKVGRLRVDLIRYGLENNGLGFIPLSFVYAVRIV